MYIYQLDKIFFFKFHSLSQSLRAVYKLLLKIMAKWALKKRKFSFNKKKITITRKRGPLPS